MSTYFFDPVSGSDSNTGITSGSPWQTDTKFNATTLNPDDNVLVKCGTSWFAALVPNGAGTAGHPITIGQYGSGANPVISGYITINAGDWTSIGGSLYTYTNGAFSATKMNLLNLDGSNVAYGRFPKTGWNTFSTHTGTTVISGTGLPNSPSFIGGEVVIRQKHYQMDNLTITGQASGDITYSGGSTTPTNNNGYFIQNHPNCLTKDGDWSYNAGTKTITMYFSAGPTGHVVKAPAKDTLIQLGTNSNMTVHLVDMEGANKYFVQGNHSSNITISNLTARCAGINAFDFSTIDTLNYSFVNTYDANNNGFTGINMKNTSFTFNYFNRCGDKAGMGEKGLGLTGWGSYCGVVFGGTGVLQTFNNLIQNNQVVNTGYIGIAFHGETATVNQNYVDTFCYVLDDGAGIYCWTGGTAITYSTRTISNNIVLNGIGATDGTSDVFGNQANGIYLDDNSSNITVTNNRVANMGNYCYFLHNSHEVTFTFNKGYNGSNAQLVLLHDTIVPTGALPVNFDIHDNEMVSATTTQKLFILRSNGSDSTAGDISRVGTIDNNTYGIIGAGPGIFNYQDGGGTDTDATFNTWKAAIAKDAASVFNAVTPISPPQYSYNITANPTNINLSGAWEDIKLTSYSGNVSLAAYDAFLFLQTSLPSNAAIPYPGLIALI